MIQPGDVFGIYRVIQSTGERRKSDGHALYEVECLVCGKHVELVDNTFAYPSCIIHKCVHDRSGSRKISDKHLRSIYRGMWSRCYNKSDKVYHRYGGRGIRICDKWLNSPHRFEKWANKYGYKPGLTIDRMDNDGPYSPSIG